MKFFALIPLVSVPAVLPFLTQARPGIKQRNFARGIIQEQF
jgi:hypothetical protein